MILYRKGLLIKAFAEGIKREIRERRR